MEFIRFGIRQINLSVIFLFIILLYHRVWVCVCENFQLNSNDTSEMCRKKHDQKEFSSNLAPLNRHLLHMLHLKNDAEGNMRKQKFNS